MFQFQFMHINSLYVDIKTHENEDAISVLLPAFSPLVVFFPCILGIDGEERSRLTTRNWIPLRVAAVADSVLSRVDRVDDHLLYSSCNHKPRHVKQQVRTWVIPLLDILTTGLRH